MSGPAICMVCMWWVSTVLGQAPASAPASAPAARAKLFVKSDPPGADVLIGGKKLGVTPAMLEVPVGPTTVTVQLGGFDPQSLEVEVKAGVVNKAEAVLAGPGIKIEVRTTPPGAYLLIDDKMHADPTGEPIPTPCTIVLRQPRLASLAVVKQGYADVIRKDVAVKDGLKLDIALRRGQSELLNAGMTFGLPPDKQINRPADAPLEPFRAARKVRPHKFSGDLEMSLNAVAGWQTTGLELKQGTPLKVVRVGGAWHGHLANVSDDPKARTGGRIKFRVGQVTVLMQDSYNGVAPDDGELLFEAEWTSATSWGAVDVLITVGDCVKNAELAPVNTRYRPAFVPRGATEVSGHQVQVNATVFWNSTGVEVVKGSKIRITAQGQWAGSPGVNREINSGEAMGLVLRVGDDPRDPVLPVRLGNMMEMPASGVLYLGPRDDWVQDNAGQITVTIDGKLRLVPLPAPGGASGPPPRPAN